MAEIKFQLSSSGAIAFMKSAPMQAMLGAKASAVARNAEAQGGKYAMRPQNQRTRHSVLVSTADIEAIRANSKHNTLLKALS